MHHHLCHHTSNRRADCVHAAATHTSRADANECRLEATARARLAQFCDLTLLAQWLWIGKPVKSTQVGACVSHRVGQRCATMKALVRRMSMRSDKPAPSPGTPGRRKPKLTRRASLAVRSSGGIGGVSRSIKFYFLDDTFQSLMVSNSTTASEACVRLRKKVRSVAAW